MRIFITAIFTFATIVANAAQPLSLPPAQIAAMVTQIETVMAAGLCSVANDTADHGKEEMIVILPPPVGVRHILVSDYQWMKAPGYTKSTITGHFLMSDRAVEACSADAESGRCMAYRSYWSTKPGAKAGNGVRVILK